MAVAVNDIVDKVELVLQDTTNIRWEAVELIGWLNDAVMEVIREKPEASVITESVAWAAGTKQAIPVGGLILIDVVRNMGTNGTTPGKAIRFIDKRQMDAIDPGWHEADRARATIQHWMFDERNPKVFWIYPPSDETTEGEIVYSVGVAVVAAGGSIGIDDVYQSVIIDYMLYRAYSKDSDHTPNAQRALGHYQAFLMSIGSQERIEAMFDPKSKG